MHSCVLFKLWQKMIFHQGCQLASILIEFKFEFREILLSLCEVQVVLIGFRLSLSNFCQKSINLFRDRIEIRVRGFCFRDWPKRARSASSSLQP